MPLIHITGMSGTGKSSIMHELNNRGYVFQMNLVSLQET